MLPEENSEIYKLLYDVEVGLRELIIHVLESNYGPKWWKQRLPNDVKESAMIGWEIERGAKWSQTISHHPIYYTDFTDLKKILIRKDNWLDVFQHIFARSDILSETLSEIEPIRNKIAHNRRATVTDIEIVKAAHSKIASQIGEELFMNFIRECTVAESILENIIGLRNEALRGIKDCQEIKKLEVLKYWEKVHKCWWFDQDYLGSEIEGISIFFELLTKYIQLPRERGKGHLIEKWLESEKIIEKYDTAKIEFKELLKNWREK